MTDRGGRFTRWGRSGARGLLIPLCGSICVVGSAAVLQAEEASRSVYDVRVDGRSVSVERCDGRGGPASFVQILSSEPVVIELAMPKDVAASTDPAWRIETLYPATITLDRTRPMVRTDRANKILIRSADPEMLYIVVQPPDPRAPDPADGVVIHAGDRGIPGDGAAVLTRELQGLIDEAGGRPGGGVVYLPAGLYRTGTLAMRSRVTLYLAQGACLQGSTNPADYPLDPRTTEQPDRTEDIRSRLILFDGIEHAAVRGRGRIDGSAQIVRAELRRVPNLIRVRHSRHVEIEGLLLTRAAGWCTHIYHSDHVSVRDITSISHWSDGLDVDNSRQVSVENVMIDSYDDAYVIKATGFEGTADRVGQISLRDALLRTVKSCVKIGTETRAQAMEHISFENITVAGARGALVIYVRDGATVRDIRYRNVRIVEAERALDWNIRARLAPGRLRDVRIEGLRIDPALTSQFAGLDAEHTIDGVRMSDVIRDGKPATTLEAAGIQIGAFVTDVSLVLPVGQ